MRTESWEVNLLVDGAHVVRVVEITEPFFIRCASAEVKAIKEAERAGAGAVCALRSQFLAEWETDR